MQKFSPKTPQQFLASRKTGGPRPSLHHGAKPPPIESGIPIPSSLKGPGTGNRTHFYPFEHMKVGDSFWVQHSGPNACTRGACVAFAKKSGWAFITRAQSQDGRPTAQLGSKSRSKLAGIRVWRIS